MGKHVDIVEDPPEERLIAELRAAMMRRCRKCPLADCPMVQSSSGSEEVRLIILRAVLKVRIGVMERHGTFKEVMGLQKELDQVNRWITDEKAKTR